MPQRTKQEELRLVMEPITHNLPAPIRNLITSVIGPKCFESLVLNVNYNDKECTSLALSKMLGLGIVAASSVVKVPQIVKLVSSQSAEGVSFLSYLLETTAYLVTLAY